MRVRVLLLAMALLLFVSTVPTAEAAREPVGSCDSGAIVESCSVYCINPPCPQYVCVNTIERICTGG